MSAFELTDQDRYLEDDARTAAIEDAARLIEAMTAEEVDEMERELLDERAAIDAEAAAERRDEAARYAYELSAAGQAAMRVWDEYGGGF